MWTEMPTLNCAVTFVAEKLTANNKMSGRMAFFINVLVVLMN